MTEHSGSGEYAQSLSIHASPDQIFDFVADVGNLPKYLPTIKQSEDKAGDRVKLKGESEGHKFTGEGDFRADRDNYRLEWGADQNYYSGYLQITPDNGGSSKVDVHLFFRDDGGHHYKPVPDEVEEGLLNSLHSIEHFVTGQGGKEDSLA